jgi:hypothetical protein
MKVVDLNQEPRTFVVRKDATITTGMGTRRRWRESTERPKPSML